MVFNKKDLAKAFSPSKVKRPTKKPLGNVSKPSASGSTTSTIRTETGSQTSIKVIVRVRPHNEHERQNNCRTVVKIVDSRMLIFDPKEEVNPFFYQGVAQKGRDLLKKQNKELQFIFDRVFDTACSNNDVFEGSTKDLIRSLLDGYNCSVFAYGATGAGKTHTMLGNTSDLGITYRTVAELFSEIEKQGEQREFNLGVTYLEIYNENVQDLLHRSGPLHLRDDGRCGVIVAGLKIITISNADELLSLLAKGNKNRTQHPTDANEESSRSHAVFQVYINVTNKLDGQVRHVKLSMIDLAGSERASATGCKGPRFKEGANINKSLLALGNCINNLADGAKHITYRDSKLTRLLKDSLGGNCQTVMIANVSPSSFSYEDTYNTLRYANRAKKIKTHIKKNIVSCELHVTSYIKMVEEQKKEIEYLKQKLLAFESGTVCSSSEPKENKVNKEADKHAEALRNKLIHLLQKKKSLNEKVLSLESADKILCCRMLYKKAADERLHNLTAAVDAQSPEEQNASGKSRLTKSLHYFERQRSALKIQIEAAWDELCTVETELQKLDEQIKSKEAEKAKSASELENCKIEKTRVQQQYEHVKKVSNLQQCEMQSIYSMIKMMSTTLQNYYNMMRGHGTMTEKTMEEFKQLVKKLEGVKNIKWSDIEQMNEEENFYNLTCLSIPQLMDPCTSNMPIYTLDEAQDNEQESCTKDEFNTTFELPESSTIPDTQNITITLQEKPDRTLDKQTNVEGVGKNLGNPAPLMQNNRKRVLSDKNNTNDRTPLKQAKKHGSSEKCVPSSTGTKDKENKFYKLDKVQPLMNAKSVAIINKLKADKQKCITSLSKHSVNTDASGPLKAVREKERRGLSTVHPYQKPNDKQKLGAVPPSSRAPW